jgi:hypothetical protein
MVEVFEQGDKNNAVSCKISTFEDEDSTERGAEQVPARPHRDRKIEGHDRKDPGSRHIHPGTKLILRWNP